VGLLLIAPKLHWHIRKLPRARETENIPYLVAGKERVNLNLALQKMKSQLGITSVMSMSPGKLGGVLLRAGLVSEVNIMVLPSIIGGFKTPSLFQSPGLKTDEWPIRLKLVWAQVQSDSRVWLRYEMLSEKKPLRKRMTKVHKQH